MMSNTPITRNKRLRTFQSLYEQVNSGDPWHGPSLTSILNRINQKTLSTNSPSTGKSIASMLLHILAWRKFVLSKINQEAIDIMLDSDDDWPTLYTEPYDIIEDLQICFKDLQSALETKTDDWLETIVPNKEYSYEVMLYGLINHDVHHFAQILVIDKEVSMG